MVKNFFITGINAKTGKMLTKYNPLFITNAIISVKISKSGIRIPFMQHTN